MTKVPAFTVGFLLIPVIGTFNFRLAGSSGEKNKSKAVSFILFSSGFDKTKRTGEKFY